MSNWGLHNVQGEGGGAQTEKIPENSEKIE